MQYISCLYISHLILNKLLYSTLLKMKILLVYFVLSFGLVWFQFCDMNVNEFIVHFILYSQSNMSIPFTQLHHSHLCVLSLQKPLKWHNPCNAILVEMLFHFMPLTSTPYTYIYTKNILPLILIKSADSMPNLVLTKKKKNTLRSNVAYTSSPHSIT